MCSGEGATVFRGREAEIITALAVPSNGPPPLRLCGGLAEHDPCIACQQPTDDVVTLWGRSAFVCNACRDTITSGMVVLAVIAMRLGVRR